MVCSRCGDAAVVKRDDGYYCGKCALTRDWQEVIGIIQDARVETPIAGGYSPSIEDETADPFARTA